MRLPRWGALDKAAGSSVLLASGLVHYLLLGLSVWCEMSSRIPAFCPLGLEAPSVTGEDISRCCIMPPAVKMFPSEKPLLLGSGHPH